jgi:putative transcriptional regulator
MKKEESMSKVSEKIHSTKEKAPPDVKTIRTCLGMTRAEFARRFSFSVETLRHWERGDRVPRGSARILLGLIARNPQLVMESLTQPNPLASSQAIA